MVDSRESVVFLFLYFYYYYGFSRGTLKLKPEATISPNHTSHDMADQTSDIISQYLGLFCFGSSE